MFLFPRISCQKRHGGVFCARGKGKAHPEGSRVYCRAPRDGARNGKDFRRKQIDDSYGSDKLERLIWAIQ